MPSNKPKPPETNKNTGAGDGVGGRTRAPTEQTNNTLPPLSLLTPPPRLSAPLHPQLSSRADAEAEPPSHQIFFLFRLAPPRPI